MAKKWKDVKKKAKSPAAKAAQDIIDSAPKTWMLPPHDDFIDELVADIRSLVESMKKVSWKPKQIFTYSSPPGTRANPILVEPNELSRMLNNPEQDPKRILDIGNGIWLIGYKFYKGTFV